MKIKNEVIQVPKQQTISISSLFDFSSTDKYLILNSNGVQHQTDTGTFVYNGKDIAKSSYYPDTRSSSILFIKTGNDYVNDKYGSISNIKYRTSTDTLNLDIVTIATTNYLDPSYLHSLDNIDLVTKSITQNEYSVSVLTGNTINKSIVDIARSYVGRQWDVNQGWQFIATLSALANTSLPISSENIQSDSVDNGSWKVKFDGEKQTGDWQSKLAVGDILFVSSADKMDSAAAIVTSIKDGIKVIDTAVNNSNINGNIVKILPEHLLSDEAVYDLIYDKQVLIYTQINAPVVNTPITTTKETSNSPYTVGSGNKTIYVTPMADIKLGVDERFNIYLDHIFRAGDWSQYVTQTVSNLPKWAFYDNNTGLLYGTTPQVASSSTIYVNGKIGSMNASDMMKIIVDKNQTVDLKDVAWTAGKTYTLDAYKGDIGTYYLTTNENASWLSIDQTGKIHGIPPLSQMGHNIDVNVYQQNGYNAPFNNDEFIIHVVQPINVVGVHA